MRKNGFFIPPTNPRRPRLSNVRIDEVRDYERFYGRQRDRVEILEVSDIKDVRLKYRNDVILAKLDAVNTGKSVFAAYQAQQYLEEESASIQRLADRGADLVPDELKAEQFTDWIQPQAYSREESSIHPIWHCQLAHEPRQDATLGIEEGLWDVRWSWCRRSTESGWQHRKRDGSGR